MTGLDPNQASEIRDLIRSIGKERTIILSTHNLAEVQITCQRVLIIDKGRIVADDTPDGLARGGGGTRYHVAVLAGRKPEAARDVFKKLRGIESVRELRREGDEVVLEILGKTTDDLRAEIFRAAVEGGLVLVGLTAKAQNLEQVFQELTTGRAEQDADEDEAEALDDSDEDDSDEDQDDEDDSDEDQDDEDEDADRKKGA